MSDYQKLKAEYEKLKAKCDKQKFMISQLTDLLMMVLDYTNFIKSKIVGKIETTGDKDV